MLVRVRELEVEGLVKFTRWVGGVEGIFVFVFIFVFVSV